MIQYCYYLITIVETIHRAAEWKDFEVVICTESGPKIKKNDSIVDDLFHCFLFIAVHSVLLSKVRLCICRSNVCKTFPLYIASIIDLCRLIIYAHDLLNLG
jgi:hypothetical protein